MAQEEFDDDNAALLRAARINDEQALEESEGSLEQKGAEGELTEPPKNHTPTFVLAFLVAGVSDLADIFVIGAIPVAGDVLDAVTGAVLASLFLVIGGKRKMRKLAATGVATIIEFLPFGITDILPTYTLQVLYAWHTTRKENQTQES